MIIHRFAAALRHQDWGTAFLDFLIVVAGIFVGLQVDDWNQERQARAREVVALTAVREEILENVESLSFSVAHAQSSHAATEEFFTRVGGAAILPDEMDSLLARIGSQTNTTLSASAIEALLLSGNLAEISDASLRQSIISLRERYTSHREVERYNGNIVEEHFVAALNSKISMIGIINRLAISSGIAQPIMVESSNQIDNRHLLDDQLIQNLVGGLGYTLKIQILSSEKLSGDLSQIASDIDSHLNQLRDQSPRQG